jgi:hypothetical protein
VTLAEVPVIGFAVTAEMTGAPTGGAAVTNVKLADVVELPAEFAETTAKSYVTPDVNPPRVTEWLVDRAEFRPEDEP